MEAKDSRTPEFIEMVRKRVHFFCRNKSYLNAEDMFHSVYLKFLEGGRDRSTVDQVCVDVVREEYGRDTESKYAEARKAFNVAESYEEIEADKYTYGGDLTEFEIKRDAHKLIAKLRDERTRSIATDIYIHGFNQCELIKKYDMTESRISQLNEEIIDELKLHARPRPPFASVPSAIQPLFSGEWVKVARLADDLGCNYVELCRMFRQGMIPYLKGPGNSRVVDEATYKILMDLKKQCDNDWHLHLPFPIKHEASGEIGGAWPLGQKAEPKAVQPKPQQLVAHTQPASDTKKRVLDKAKRFYNLGRFESAAEFFMLYHELV